MFLSWHGLSFRCIWKSMWTIFKIHFWYLIKAPGGLEVDFSCTSKVEFTNWNPGVAEPDEPVQLLNAEESACFCLDPVLTGKHSLCLGIADKHNQATAHESEHLWKKYIKGKLNTKQLCHTKFLKPQWHCWSVQSGISTWAWKLNTAGKIHKGENWTQSNSHSNTKFTVSTERVNIKKCNEQIHWPPKICWLPVLLRPNILCRSSAGQ